MRRPQRAAHVRPAVLTDDAFYPAALQRLQTVLATIHMAAQPRTSSASIVEAVGRRTTFESAAPRGGEHYRRVLRRALARVNRLAESIEIDVSGRRDYKPPGAVKCPGCSRGQRISARYCDGCGAALASDNGESPDPEAS